jgi:hypothetical protein
LENHKSRRVVTFTAASNYRHRCGDNEVLIALFLSMRAIDSFQIPEIPPSFLGLMGLSNGVYLLSKFVPGKSEENRAAGTAPNTPSRAPRCRQVGGINFECYRPRTDARHSPVFLIKLPTSRRIQQAHGGRP